MLSTTFLTFKFEKINYNFGQEKLLTEYPEKCFVRFKRVKEN